MPKGKGYGKARSKFVPKSNLRQKGPKGKAQKSVRQIKKEIKSWRIPKKKQKGR